MATGDGRYGSNKSANPDIPPHQNCYFEPKVKNILKNEEHFEK